MGNSVTRFAKIAAFIVMGIAATESHGLAQSKSGRIDKLITLYHKYGQFNGVILVAQRGQVVYEHAFGQSNFELNSPNTVDTKFEIAGDVLGHPFCYLSKLKPGKCWSTAMRVFDRVCVVSSQVDCDCLGDR
jgi:hypothetical protein